MNPGLILLGHWECFFGRSDELTPAPLTNVGAFTKQLQAWEWHQPKERHARFNVYY
jgi:hypothetical protein